MPNIVLETQSLTRHYGKIKAIQKLDLTVKQGEIYGILGPNGSGKTTTLSILSGALFATSGDYKWFGMEGRQFDRRKLGVLLETPNFYPYLSGYHNLKISASIKGVRGDAEIWQALRHTGLENRARHRFRTYSYGMKQRLAIASALLGNPPVLILDEPTNGLDPQGIAEIRELIRRIASDGTTILLASHLLDEVQKTCSHVAVLRSGQLLFSGKVSELTHTGNTFCLASVDMNLLREQLLASPGVQDLTSVDGLFQVTFSEATAPDEINRFLMSRGVSLTHLSEKKHSLEEHFLQLLNNHEESHPNS